MNSAADLPKFVKAYQAIRLPRIKYAHSVVEDNEYLYYLPDGPEQKERDTIWANIQPPPPAPGERPKFKPMDEPPSSPRDPKWIRYFAGHDVVDFVSPLSICVLSC